MYCFERLELSATYSLMALMRLEISSENSFYAANIRGDNSLQLFILSKRFGWICGSVLLYVKLPWNFPLRFESFAWPMLFATMATLSVSIVSMRLGSFTYSTSGSHRGQSFQLFYKKTKKPLHKQGLHPAEIPKAMKRDGLLGFTTRINWKLRPTSFVVNLPRSGRPQKELRWFRQRVISPTSRSPTALVASPTRWVASPTSYWSLRQRQISSNNFVIT